MNPVLRFKEFTDDWEEKQLGELVNVKSGKDYKHLSKGDIPVYGTGGIISYVSDSLSIEDGIGIGRKGTIDKPVYLKAPYWTVDTLFYCLTNQNKHFIYYLFNTIQWKKYDESTGVPSLSKSNIEKIKTFIPSLQEQEKIGNFLSLMDKKIDLQKYKIELLKERKKGYIQKIFKQEIRFKDEHGQDYPDWEEKKLGEIGKIKAGKDIKKDQLVSSGYPVYGNALTNKGLLGFYKTYEIEDEALTITGRGDIGKTFYRKGKFNTVGRLISLVPNNQNPYFLSIAISLIKIFNESTGVPQLTAVQLSDYKIKVPSLQEQEKIADFLSQQDEVIEKEEEKLALLIEQKKGLLQKLFV